LQLFPINGDVQVNFTVSRKISAQPAGTVGALGGLGKMRRVDDLRSRSFWTQTPLGAFGGVSIILPLDRVALRRTSSALPDHWRKQFTPTWRDAMLRRRCLLSLSLLACVCAAARAQQQELPPPAPVPSSQPPAATVVAATVNGQPIRELDVYRGLLGTTPARYQELRPEVLTFLIDNMLVDQYLDQMKVAVDAKEVDVQLDKIKDELKQRGQKLEDFSKNLLLTETEMRTQLQAGLRWDKFIAQYATDKALVDFFNGNKAIFDGSQMRARHILIKCPPADAAKAEEAKNKLLLFKKQIEEDVAKGLAAAGQLEPLKLEEKRRLLLEETFGTVAGKMSDCPSKIYGGNLGWFPRISNAVTEPFSRAAFLLKPFEMSDVVQSELGYHLILALDSKPGVERKFEDIREVVKEVYADRMREAIVVRMRQTAKIEMVPAPK
jgi:parvulin-like peptidyl-prolyl isomerase